MAMGRDRRSDRPSAGAGPGGVPGGEEGEAAAGGEGRWSQGETPVHGHRQRLQIQGPGTAHSPPGAEGPVQQREREDQPEEEEESEGSGEEEKEGAAGGGRHPHEVRGAALRGVRGCLVCCVISCIKTK